MSRTVLPLLLLLSWCSSAGAGVANVEFKFTPIVGDPSTAGQVETVPGKASVFINNVLTADQEVGGRIASVDSFSSKGDPVFLTVNPTVGMLFSEKVQSMLNNLVSRNIFPEAEQ
jgi:hypothetical protein